MNRTNRQFNNIGKLDLVCNKGLSFRLVLRWETGELVYKPITGVAKAAPVRLTVTAHGMKEGWRGAISGVKGPYRLNARSIPPAQADYHAVTVIDANTLAINGINAEDFPAYVSGGELQYFRPADLSVIASAAFTVYDKNTGTNLYTGATVTLDDTAKTITVDISTSASAAFTFSDAAYLLKLTPNSGSAFGLVAGSFRAGRADQNASGSSPAVDDIVVVTSAGYDAGALVVRGLGEGGGSGNIDGGTPSTNYGATTPINGGIP